MMIGHNITILGDHEAGAGGSTGVSAGRVDAAGQRHHAIHIVGIDLCGGQRIHFGIQNTAAGAGAILEAFQLLLQGSTLLIHIVQQDGKLLIPLIFPVGAGQHRRQTAAADHQYNRHHQSNGALQDDLASLFALLFLLSLRLFCRRLFLDRGLMNPIGLIIHIGCAGEGLLLLTGAGAVIKTILRSLGLRCGGFRLHRFIFKGFHIFPPG